MRRSFLLACLMAFTVSTLSIKIPLKHRELAERQSETKYVFAHFIVGIVASYSQDDWSNDIRLAQEIGIDGFALNIGKDSYNDQQLGNAYSAAESLGFKMFISFDFSYWNSGDVGTIASYMNNYGTRPAQFMYNGKAFVSTFAGDGFDWRAAEAQSIPLFSCPNWQPGSLNTASADCGFSWDAWASSSNQPIDMNKTTDSDSNYIQTLGSRPYMMPISPWFFTHYGPDTYSKNWIFYSDSLWNTRWNQALELAPQFLEIVTWNDFGESHYIGPLHDDNQSVYAGGATGAQKWVPGFTHDAWRQVAKPYIQAYKAGASSPTVTDQSLVYYYRPNPKDAGCSDPVGKPAGFEFDDDSIFVTAIVSAAGTVQVQTGPNTYSADVPAGITTIAVPMGIGSQTFTFKNPDGTVAMTGASPMDISGSCSVNNFNAFVGSVQP